MVSYEVTFFIVGGKENILENDGIFIKIFGMRGDSGVRNLKCLRKQGTANNQDGEVCIQK